MWMKLSLKKREKQQERGKEISWKSSITLTDTRSIRGYYQRIHKHPGKMENKNVYSYSLK